MPVFNNILAGAAGSGGAAADYTIDRSLRFNSADGAYLGAAFGTPTDQDVFTLSMWVKRSALGSTQHLFGVSTNHSFGFTSGDALNLTFGGSSALTTTALFRDPSAWYHIVWTQSGTSHTIYVNNVSVGTATATSSVFNTAVAHQLGAGNTTNFFNGYFADVHFIDGQALAATDFGKLDDNNVWQPKAYSGTYGTNGFHLDFSDNSSKDALGYDAAGSNDWTVNNLTASATKWSSYLIPQSPASFDSSYPASEAFDGSIAANQEARLNGGSYADRYIDFIPTGGIAFSNQIEMYVGASDFEYSYNGGSNVAVTADAWHTVASGGGTLTSIRIQRTQSLTHTWRALRVDGTILVDGDPAGTDSLIDTPTNYTASSGNNGGNYATLNPLLTQSAYLSNGNLELDSAGWGHIDAYATIGLTSSKWYWEVTFTGDTNAEPYMGISSVPPEGAAIGQVSGSYGRSKATKTYIGGTVNNSGGNISIGTGDTIGFALDLDNGTLQVYVNGTAESSQLASSLDLTKTWFPAGSIYGPNCQLKFNFGQRPFSISSVPTGHKSLCTQNLDDPLIDDGSTAFDAVKIDNASTTGSITGLSFAPDFAWFKSRGDAGNHFLLDFIRDDGILRVNLANDEVTGTDYIDWNSDGVGYKNGLVDSGSSNIVWLWDAGTTTDTNNTAGSITPTGVRANPSAGFSIVSYTGDGNASATIGHGLNAAPEMIMVKNRDVADDGSVYHVGTDATNPQNYFLKLFATSATGSAARSDAGAMWNDTAPTSSVFSVGTEDNVNASGENYIAYCFAPVAGYSAFGSYEGNGSTDGPFAYTGFRPKWILLKRSDGGAENWVVYDTARNTQNVMGEQLYPNLSSAKADAGTNPSYAILDSVSNGFKIRGSHTSFNLSGGTFIYAAFAENPFKYARAR